MLKAVISTFAVLVGSAFAFLMGAISMTGLNLSIPVNMVFFLGYNGFVLLGVVIALKQVWASKSGSDADE